MSEAINFMWSKPVKNRINNKVRLAKLAKRLAERLKKKAR